MDAKQKRLKDFDAACAAYKKAFNKPSPIGFLIGAY